ncbi:MAG: glycosyltransferase family 2 protein [Candidatus Aenigmarchaeota archaeon]|nr:glycosyltransferase family 2 protein [Candidatus Aenigmarchaeota archaeon]
MTVPKVSIVIPSYNGKNLTVNLLNSIKETVYKDYEVIVVDNGSDDGCYEYVKEHFPDAKAVKIKINRGVTGAWNEGIKNSRGRYIVVMNNDMIVDPNWLTELVKVAESDNKIGIVGSVLMDFNSAKTDVIQRLGYVEIDKVILKFVPVAKDEIYRNQFPDVLKVDHTFGLVKREVIDKIVEFDEKNFMSWDEVDFCYRAKKFGYTTVTATKSKIYHIGSVTVKKEPYIRVFHYHKNRIRFMLKNLSLFRKLVNVPLTLVYYMFEIMFRLVRGDSQYSRAVLNGIFWNIKNVRDYI